MLLHLTPRCYSPYESVEIVDLRIAEFGMVLTGGRDVVARKPYPNKRYAVACRNIGRKAFDGVLIDAPSVGVFTMVARWSVNASFLATHQVEYTILDSDFDAVTEQMTLWNAMSPGLGGWPSRHPPGLPYVAPVHAQPRMEVVDPRHRIGVITDRLDAQGRIVERHERFSIPTVERGRLVDRNKHRDRMPLIDHAFIIDATQKVHAHAQPVMTVNFA